MLRPGRAVIAAALLWSSSAYPDEPLETVSIEYRAAPCGDTVRFVERVRARTTRFNLGEDAVELRHFVVAIERLDGGYSGELRIVSPGGPLQVRHITARECEEVFDAMALMTALAIDPTSPVSPEPADPVEQSAIDQPPERDALPSPPKPESPDDAETLHPDRHYWEFGVGAHAVATSGLTPELVFGGQGNLNISWETGSVLSPTMRLLARYQVGPSVMGSNGVAKFRLLSAGLELCPLALPPARLLLFRPCFVGDAGILTGEGSEVENARSAERFFSAIGGAMRAELRVHRLLGFDGAIAASFPLRRDRFVISEDVVSQADLATIVASLGATVWFY